MSKIQKFEFKSDLDFLKKLNAFLNFELFEFHVGQRQE